MILKLKTVEIKDERFLKSFTGVDSKRYAVIRPQFESIITAYQARKRKLASKPKRKSGAGRPPTLPTIDDKLVFVLHYLKAYPTMDNLASTFGMSRSNTCSLVHLHAKHLKQSLEKLDVLPKRELDEPEEYKITRKFY